MPVDNPEALVDDVKHYAPGYLALEAERHSAEFDPEILVKPLRGGLW